MSEEVPSNSLPRRYWRVIKAVIKLIFVGGCSIPEAAVRMFTEPFFCLPMIYGSPPFKEALKPELCYVALRDTDNLPWGTQEQAPSLVSLY